MCVFNLRTEIYYLKHIRICVWPQCVQIVQYKTTLLDVCVFILFSKLNLRLTATTTSKPTLKISLSRPDFDYETHHFIR